jgi:hypothetical protein
MIFQLCVCSLVCAYTMYQCYRLCEDIYAGMRRLPARAMDGGLFAVKQIVNYNYGQKERNPVNNVRFYSKADEDKAFPIPRSEV